MKKFYKFIFVKNDINGVPLYVGDSVKVTRAHIHYIVEDDYAYDNNTIDIPEQSWEGEIVLLLSKGIRIKTPDGYNGYVKANLTNMRYIKWTWEKL